MSEAAIDGGGQAAPALRILHRGRRYIARYLRCDDTPWVAVTFEYWKPAPTLEGEFSGEGFFRHRRMNAIGIMAAENDWFQDDEILEVLAAIRAATPGYRRIGYGGSMGGFAAINFAHALELASLVAVIPQFSIDAAKAPYETRWRDEAARISFRHDRIADMPPVTRGWMVFDPWCVDGLHARDIQRRHRLGEVAVPFGGHAEMLMLQQADVYTDMFTDMLAERFDPAAFRRRWRAARRRSAAFWLGLAQALLQRGKRDAALRCLDAARGLPHPEPAWIDLTEADVHLAAGDFARAAALARGWAEDPAFGGPARERLARVPAANGVAPVAEPPWLPVAEPALARVARLAAPRLAASAAPALAHAVAPRWWRVAVPVLARVAAPLLARVAARPWWRRAAGFLVRRLRRRWLRPGGGVSD